MQPILKSCCGIDVHKSMIKASLAKGPLDKPPKVFARTFSTMTSDLLKLKYWLRESDVEAVAMESTGVYWKPIFNILDVKDSEWIASLLRCGLMHGPFAKARDIDSDYSRNQQDLGIGNHR